MNADDDLGIQMVPIKQITVLNPRERGKRKFGQIIGNISKLGLKKPVTVAPVDGKSGDAKYMLVCGQGRLEAYAALGQESIPAIVVQGSKEDLLLMSLAENLARRQHSPVELVRCYVERIEKFDRELNAFVTLTFDQAFESAGDAERQARPGEDLPPFLRRLDDQRLVPVVPVRRLFVLRIQVRDDVLALRAGV